MEDIYLDKKEFENLPEYSCSLPTGTTIGKKWKKSNHFSPDIKNGEKWWLCEYVDIGDPTHVGITYKRLLVRDSEEWLASRSW